MPNNVYINGEIFPENDAKISVFDHGLLYGDGVFEGLRSYSGKVFRLEEHVDRLWESAQALCLEIPISKEQMTADINKMVAANEILDGYVRVLVTRGTGTLGLDPDLCSNPQVIIIAATIALYPPEFYSKGLEIITSSVIRNHPAALSPRVKSLNYLNNILAKMEGKQAGCIEALMLNHKGEVAECTGDNIFVIRKGELLTPPNDAGILEGITRNVVMEIAEKIGITVREIALTKHDVYIADEVFLTGSAAEVIPVVKVDNRLIGDGTPGKMTLDLNARFKKLTRE